MPRRQSIPRKAKYQQESNRVTDRFRAKLMRDGKQTLSDRILRQALARAEFQAKRPGLEVLEAALRNATPIIEVKPRRGVAPPTRSRWRSGAIAGCRSACAGSSRPRASAVARA